MHMPNPGVYISYWTTVTSSRAPLSIQLPLHHHGLWVYFSLTPTKWLLSPSTICTRGQIILWRGGPSRLCTLRCPAASLASTVMPTAHFPTPSCDNQKCLRTVTHNKHLLGWGDWPWLRNTALELPWAPSQWWGLLQLSVVKLSWGLI